MILTRAYLESYQNSMMVSIPDNIIQECYLNLASILEIGGLKFEVRRSNRRKNLGLTVDRGADLVIHSPDEINSYELAKWANTKLLWVHRKLAVKNDLVPKNGAPEFVTGENFYYLGRTYRLKLIEQQEKPLKFDGTRFYLRKDARLFASNHFKDWYVSVGKKWITKRVSLLSPRTGSAPLQVDVRDLGYRWGSCSKKSVVYINWRALQFPVRLIDYVIMHELSHLIEAHHDKGFWDALDRSMPDWRARQEEMKLKAQDIHWCHGVRDSYSPASSITSSSNLHK